MSELEMFCEFSVDIRDQVCDFDFEILVDLFLSLDAFIALSFCAEII